MYKSRKSWLIVLALALIIRTWACFPVLVERGYSNGLYPLISGLQRLLLGWLPFSVGDLLYAVAVVWLIVLLVKFVRAVFRKKNGAARLFWWKVLQRLVFWCLWIYVVFNGLWGLNYNRQGVAQQLNLSMRPYTNDELKTAMQVIIHRLSATDSGGLRARPKLEKNAYLFDESFRSYQAAALTTPFLHYRLRSVKSSLFGYMGDYLGFTGYYNPFSGEAQVNTTVPVYVLPFTTCHEIGHQLGYAKENEANFAGFLSARASMDSAFMYSIYFEMYAYGMRELYRRDSVTAKEYKKMVPQQVKNDLAGLRAFYDSYKNPFEPLITGLYGQYLKANQQPSGMRSYNEVMAFLIAYGKKYGWERI
ncbi:MAG: DUF3810 domain-containing protein [Bacteroidetes bacterium]|nr:DUF3810 domain-containing protein [Bacteroidota bacterium]